MEHVKFDYKMYALPTSQLILGTIFNGKPNFMALAWATRVNFKPPLIGMGVNKNHASHQAIVEQQEFSLCMPSSSMVDVTDYVGLVSGNRSDKSGLFEIYYGELEKAPLITSCPLNLALKLYKTVDLPTNTLFVGEIVEAWCDKECLTDAKPDIVKLDPFMLSMPDNNYWKFGENTGKAWDSGKKLKKG